MAEIIEKQELPVVITKVKIGKRDLSKSLIDQIPKGIFICHMGKRQGKEDICYGLPLVIGENGYVNELYYDSSKPFKTDGTIIGFIDSPKINSSGAYQSLAFYADENYIRKDVMTKNGYVDETFYNFGYPYYFIIWYDENNKLKKGYIDKWTMVQLDIKIEQIII
ncbi:MAG: hypothetical protein ACK5KT_12920 [Dysgonomonas sp.]